MGSTKAEENFSAVPDPLSGLSGTVERRRVRLEGSLAKKKRSR